MAAMAIQRLRATICSTEDQLAARRNSSIHDSRADSHEDLGWMPLEEAAAKMKRSANRIRSQAREGKLTRGVHFRRAAQGGLELNVKAYLDFVIEEYAPRRRPPLADRLLAQSTQSPAPQHELASVSRGLRSPPDKASLKLIPLGVWAKQVFGEYAPPIRTLRTWCRNGKILPLPRKVGRQFYCSPDARYVDHVAERIERLILGR